jgi:hypothetical protein
MLFRFQKPARLCIAIALRLPSGLESMNLGSITHSCMSIRELIGLVSLFVVTAIGFIKWRHRGHEQNSKGKENESFMKPTIYVSSTIYDFSDLRSALKYVLENLGYRVLLSEFNDFKKPLEQNSYEACLAAIGEANYFLLLLGRRVGGFYDADQRISITRMEYRCAYDLLQKRKLKLLAFVRKSLWDIREDRKALEQCLHDDEVISKELSDELVTTLQNHSSTFVNDAKSIFDFLREVSRLKEMKDAIAGAGNFPVGNWIHTFSTLDDIMATLTVELNIKHSLRRESLVANLKLEVLTNLSALLNKDRKGQIHPSSQLYGMPARGHLSGGLDDTSQIAGKRLRWLGMYLMFAAPIAKLRSQYLDESLTSSEFMEFNTTTQELQPSLLHRRMLELKENLGRLRFLSQSFNNERVRLTGELLAMPNDDRPIDIQNKNLVIPFSIQDCEQNIVMLSVAVFQFLNGKATALNSVRLNASSPIPEIAAQLENERPTRNEILGWVGAQG